MELETFLPRKTSLGSWLLCRVCVERTMMLGLASFVNEFRVENKVPFRLLTWLEEGVIEGRIVEDAEFLHLFEQDLPT